MLRFTLKRLAGLLVTLFAASFVIYSSVYVSPGSPESIIFGSRDPAPEVRAAVRHHLGLDQPFLTRYARWLGEVLHGDLGTSMVSQQKVTSVLGPPLAVTSALVAYAALLLIVAGVGLGLLSALRPGPLDALINLTMSVATAIPAFVACGVTVSVFAVSLGWFPSYGLADGVGGRLHSLTLPAVSLAIIASGLLARITRAGAREQLASDHVQTAVARGLSRPRLIRSHVLRNTAGPVISVAGLQIAGLLAGAVVVEQAFGLGGIGQVLLNSVQQKDFAVVQATCLLLVGAFVLINLVADLLVAALDPGLRRPVVA
ncbi:ABC transporter permease [Actinoplanes sp. ATCC 53533]|uniref:ABC transporter permease n=1 Tax=Actinoplanes sp. ATCC 53533 TaxID=1288362 RepID=UPI000F7A3BD2|nr:ABC transporter permease [Actinoplanes sp. ATCC 53533]RSM65518.1 ABC transporter permease [Actinoplanes sp. ATCC 53533]